MGPLSEFPLYPLSLSRIDSPSRSFQSSQLFVHVCLPWVCLYVYIHMCVLVGNLPFTATRIPVFQFFECSRFTVIPGQADIPFFLSC